MYYICKDFPLTLESQVLASTGETMLWSAECEDSLGICIIKPGPRGVHALIPRGVKCHLDVMVPAMHVFVFASFQEPWNSCM